MRAVREARGAANGSFAQSDMAERIRSFDWSKTSLGPISSWPEHLKAVVRLMLPARSQIVLFWGSDFVALYNDAYAPTIGDKHPRALGRPAQEYWSVLWDDLEPLLRKVIETGETVFAEDRPFYIERHGYPENVYFDISYSPVHDEMGDVGGVLCIVSETTARVVAQRELVIAQERLSLALSTAGMVGAFDWHVDIDKFHADARFADMFSVDSSKAQQGVPIAEYLTAIHPEDVDRVKDSFNRAVATGEKFVQEYRLLTKNNVTRWVETHGECLYLGNGKPPRFVGVVVDITDHVEAQERQRLLLLEMNHRVKNIFAVFRGLINLSARSAGTPEEMAKSLTGRVEALMRAKELVRPGLREREEPQGDGTTVDALVRTILQPYTEGSRERFVASGPEVAVGASAATSLALVLHETATNAAKYGALSAPNGTIRIEWKLAGEELRMEWEETGGPVIVVAPQKRGFGWVLTERSITGQLRGAIGYDWRPSGLRLNLTLSLACLKE